MSFRCLLATGLVAVACAFLVLHPAAAQSIEIEPANPTLQVGQSQQLEAFYVGPDGERTRDTTVVFISRSDAAPTSRSGTVTAEAPGTHEIIALRPGTETQDRIIKRFSVTVPQPAVSNVSFDAPPAQVYTGTQVPLSVEALASSGRTHYSVGMDGTLYEIDAVTRRVTRTLETGEDTPKPTWVDPHPSDPFVYVAHNGGARWWR